jgi:deoxycytidylate deaminase
MNKWDKRFMEMAYLVATWSSCIRRSIGCVIVKDKRIMTTGYNGAPAGMKTCKEKGESYTLLGSAFGNTYKNKGFLLDNAARDGSGYTLTQLKSALLILSETDRRMKSTGEDSKILLEELILRLLRI